MGSYPAYLEAYESGKLKAKVEQAKALLGAPQEDGACCLVCPRKCKVNRLENERGFCRTGRYPKIGSYFPHFGEEEVLRGSRGSGTIFFSHCNLRCAFCQNWDISQEGEGFVWTPEMIAGACISLQEKGCHNINFVTPEHVVPQVLEAIYLAIRSGLRLPIVYNTSGYDSRESLSLLEGVVDIYMPDFKFFDPRLAAKYCAAKDYPEVAKHAILEMHRQVGPLHIDETGPRAGLARRGVLVRHLVMPNHLDDSRNIFRWLYQNIGPDVYINIMAQYYPAGAVLDSNRYEAIARRLRPQEYAEALRIAREEGLSRLDQRIAVPGL